MMERTLVLIKPDAFAKHYSGEIIRRYEDEGFKICALKMMWMTKNLASKHYAEHIGKPYYEDLAGFMTSGPILAMVLSGDDAIARIRKLNGCTDPTKAEEGTIRKQFAESYRRNAVHASDSLAAADREIHIFFNETEIYDLE